MKYSPIDILRKFVLKKCIEHLIWTSEETVWLNLTFWENVTNKQYADKCWQRLKKTLLRENPDFRLVGVWARQRRGAWHIHAVCNQRFDLEWLQRKAMRAGFGQSFFVKKLDSKPETAAKLAAYIGNYSTDKNGLNKETDKGVRRMIYAGKNVRVYNMRYKSKLKQVVSSGREILDSIDDAEWKEMSKFERDFSPPDGRKKSWETWGDWYRRNRERWFEAGWSMLTKQEQEEYVELDEFLRRYLTDERWSYV